jgi:para-aminobenzoate synthetase component 1
VGWLGYEGCAALAGIRTVREADESSALGEFLLEPESRGLTDSSTACPPPSGRPGLWSLDDGSFRRAVAEIRNHIAAGDVYQVNLSRRLTVAAGPEDLSPFLRASNAGGAPDYLARLSFGEGEIVTASMELLLRRRGSLLETRPIKGTRPRGANEADDRRLAHELDRDPKERAELAMIVDLERNDLGKVAETGSVIVVDPGRVQKYATVQHRVATVRARLRHDLEWWDALSAVVPGGSVTGCPKMAAMSVISRLEPVRRGPFTGALGVVAGDGDMEIALPIRSVWSMAGSLQLAAGCGIVWESDPEAEELESRLKVSRWLDLVGEGA